MGNEIRSDLEGSTHGRIPEHCTGHQRPPRPGTPPGRRPVDGGAAQDTHRALPAHRRRPRGAAARLRPGQGGRRGRRQPPRPNARLYGLVADRAHLAALDVRTQSVAVVVSDLLGATLAEAVLPIGSDTGIEPAVEGAAALLERTAREAGAVRLHSVGIGAPGLIDPVTGELRESTGVPAWHRRLVAALQERLPATVLVENETNLAAVAEQRVGAARDQGAGTFVLLWLGFGVGAALVLDGKVRRGASGGAGEIGFLPVPGTSALPSATGCDGGFYARRLGGHL